MERRLTGKTHTFVAMLAMACLDPDERRIVYPRWGGIEAGATLSDDFRIMWEPESLESPGRSLVHRCFVDSPDAKDHGCVTRALDHVEGSISFTKSYLAGELDTYSEEDFLENLGMFLGIACHHIADLCTPCHVGQGLDCTAMGFKSRKSFHQRLERDIERLSAKAGLRLSPARIVVPTRDFFWGIASDIYTEQYLRLPAVYGDETGTVRLDMVSAVLSAAVAHTRDMWHAVFQATDMTKRQWSLQPLL